MKIITCFLIVFLFCIPAIFSQIEWIEHVIVNDFDGANCVYPADIDGDGDIDFLGAAYDDDNISWWENDHDENFTVHVIEGNFDGASSAIAIDLDRDGDMDVLGAAYEDDAISWWENDGDENFTEHIIKENFDGASSVIAVDLNHDANIDVLGAAYEGDDISWWENDGDENFTEHLIDGDFDGAISVDAIDIDGDGDMDVLGAAYEGDAITWWENDHDENFTVHTIDGNFDGAISVYAIDIDGDWDKDVLGAAHNSGDLIWWENDRDENFTEHIIDEDFDGVQSLFVADLDFDGDIDVLATAFDDNEIAWWENDGSQNFEKHSIEGNFDGASSAMSADIDHDGDFDVLGAAYNADEITWWEQIEPQNPPQAFSLLSPEDEADIYNFPLWLTWENNGDADEGDSVVFEVWLSTDEFFTDFVLIDAPSDTSVELIDLVEGDGLYWWKVHAEDIIGHQVWSIETWSFTFEYLPLPDSPSLVAPPDNQTNVSIYDVTFDWNAVDGADSYRIVVSDDPAFETTTIDEDNLTEINHVADSLDYETLYYWKVAASNRAGEGEWSESRSFTTEDFVEGIYEEEGILPVDFVLFEPYPNPFNSNLTGGVYLPEVSDLRIQVLNILGQEVGLIAQGNYEKGFHPFTFQADDLSSGIYFVNAVIPGRFNEFRKVVLLR
ncbi:MAG: FG-GAP-like repeat-containing protein [Candidatus Electryonea clarkiae]|nr:FG-GAP-like repeat-containing protein [Candidatus Electryonea clarkiae]MDP8285699.1 FG-GAP-like repeat-containing protein [Candidatus Electryonea clarkiae]